MRVELSFLNKNQKVILIEPSFTKTPLLKVFNVSTKSEYPELSDLFKSSSNNLKKDLETFQTPSYVADIMVRAMLMENPRARYMIEHVDFFFFFCTFYI